MPRYLRSPVKQITTLLIPAIGLAFGLAGCSSRDVTDAASQPAAASEDAIVVTDQRGVEHTFTEPVESIVTTVIPAPSMITAIDQGYDKIHGVNQATVMRDEGSTFETMFPESVTNTVVSGPDFVPNVEEITKIDPDVVIQWGDRGDDDTFIEPIEAAGYPVIGLEYGTQEDLETWVKLFATLLGKEERGEEILSTMHETIDRLEEFAQQQDSSPTTIFLRSAGDGGYNAGMSSDEAYMNTWMTMGGATNVGKGVEYSTTNATNVEQLLEWDPEYIFVSGMTALTPEDIYNDPAMSELDAVKNNRIYAVPSGGFWWDPPSAESHLMFLWATQVLYPETAEFDLREEMKETYQFLYDYELTDDEIDKILKFEQNSEADGYDQFNR